MANFLRFRSKSGCDWTENELYVYNITIQFQDVVDFFGRELGSIDHLDPNLLSSADPSTATHFSKETYCFLAYLDLASRANSRQRPMDELAQSILGVTGFEELGTVLCTHYDIPLTICEDRQQVALADVCLIHLNSSLIPLVVQEDKMTFKTYNVQDQVIAAAIATFQHNNRERGHRGLPLLDMMTIPCITTVGTRPTFYKVPVTSQLSNSVIAGRYPSEPTVVKCCSPPSQRIEGMEVPDYRRAALQYYDAFHGLAKTCWTTFLDGCI